MVGNRCTLSPRCARRAAGLGARRLPGGVAGGAALCSWGLHRRRLQTREPAGAGESGVSPGPPGEGLPPAAGLDLCPLLPPEHVRGRGLREHCVHCGRSIACLLRHPSVETTVASECENSCQPGSSPDCPAASARSRSAAGSSAARGAAAPRPARASSSAARGAARSTSAARRAQRRSGKRTESCARASFDSVAKCYCTAPNGPADWHCRCWEWH